MTDESNSEIQVQDFSVALDINGKFFAFEDALKKINIFDYSFFNKDIEYFDNYTDYKIIKKEKKIIKNIDDLIQNVTEIFRYSLNKYCEVDVVSPDEKYIIVTQVVFDILFEKYKSDSESMTLNRYSEYICESMPKLKMDDFDNLDEYNGETKQDKLKYRTDSLSEVINTHIKNKLKNLKKYLSVGVEDNFQDSIEYQDGKKSYRDYIRLGINPASAVSFFEDRSNYNEKTFKKYTLDSILFRCLSITSINDGEEVKRLLPTGKQSKRTYSSSKNTPPKRFILENNDYERFVSIFIEGYEENSKQYFTKTMNFYHLEINQRIDYIYKLSTYLENNKMPKIDKNYIYSIRHTPDIFQPMEKNNKIDFHKHKNYYTPMIFLDEHFQGFYLENEKPEIPATYALDMYIRALTLELFKYHFKFESQNYDEISEFIERRYNVLKYHDTDKLWSYMDNFDGKITDELYNKISKMFHDVPEYSSDGDNKKIETIIKKFIKRNREVNNSLFYPRLDNKKNKK